ncbi:MAG TPA: hypothetical protein VH116_12240 [Gemmatimonadales bacterium]|jgi:hypothetical protein|nr:hypothetical protein [Gemmatimonadales bacterium]
MPATRCRIWGGLAAAALITAACHSTTAPQPQLSNPQQLSSDLQTVAGVFTSPTFQSFSALRNAAGSPVGPAAPAGALLGAAPIVAPRTSTQPYAGAMARLQALRLAASTLNPSISASVIPPSILGETFEWSTTTHQYAANPSASPAAPANGIRLILYATDPITGAIVESPLTPVGYLDLLDLSTTNTNTVRVILAGGTPASPGTTYVDYTISGTVTRNSSNVATAFNASAVGYVSDGAGGHRLDFNASFAATHLDTTPSAQIDVTWNLNTPAVSLALHETVAAVDANDATITIDFSITHGTETVRAAGTITLASGTITADVTIYLNGEAYAHITGSANATTNSIQIRHEDGTQLSTSELQAVSQLFSAPDQIAAAIDDLFHPAEHLMGA